MDTLMTTLMQKTKENSPNRVKRIEDFRKQRDENLKSILDKLFNTILESKFEESMLKASEQGYNSTIIYKFGYTDEFEGYRMSFLLRGPMNDRKGEGSGLDFFYYKEITPVIERLKKHFLPMHLFLKYDKSKRENLIIVSWKEQNQV